MASNTTGRFASLKIIFNVAIKNIFFFLWTRSKPLWPLASILQCCSYKKMILFLFFFSVASFEVRSYYFSRLNDFMIFVDIFDDICACAIFFSVYSVFLLVLTWRKRASEWTVVWGRIDRSIEVKRKKWR